MSNFRITTNGLFRNYRTNLSKNNSSLSDAMSKVQTGRKFDSYAEDPAEASKAWRLRRSYWRTGDQIDNTNYAISKFESAYEAMESIVDGDAGSGEYGLNGILDAIYGLSDTSGGARVTLGETLLRTSENMVAVLNTKYGDDFVFAGADGENVPFTWDGDKLLYRGVDVNADIMKTPADFGFSDALLEQFGLTSTALGEFYDPEKLDLEQAVLEKPLSKAEFEKDGYVEGSGSLDDQYAAYQTAYLQRNANAAAADGSKTLKVESFAQADSLYPKLKLFQEYAGTYASTYGAYGEGKGDYEKLQKMANEKTYLDIGIGMQESARGEIITGSAFNTAISGLNFLGYGKDQNLAVMVRELGTIFSRADRETGAYESETDEKRASELLTMMHDAVAYSQGQHTQLDANARYLRTNLDQLETNKAELDKQIVDTEDLEMGDAITQMTWAKYCYDAALRIGTNILSQSLLDYMS